MIFCMCVCFFFVFFLFSIFAIHIHCQRRNSIYGNGWYCVCVWMYVCSVIETKWIHVTYCNVHTRREDFQLELLQFAEDENNIKRFRKQKEEIQKQQQKKRMFLCCHKSEQLTWSASVYIVRTAIGIKWIGICIDRQSVSFQLLWRVDRFVWILP